MVADDYCLNNIYATIYAHDTIFQIIVFIKIMNNTMY
jgi:hypothetical protein